MKKKLFAAALSLAMASILMVSSSFAWFTVSTAPEIADIDVTMTATENLEIAKATNKDTAPSEVTANDGTDETKWGATVSSFTGTVNFPATVPANETDKATGATGNITNKISTVTYGADGRTTGLIPATAPTNLTNGVGYYTATPSTAAGSKNVAAVFGVWLRTNKAGNVTGTITVPESSKFKVAFDVGGTLYASGSSFALTADTATLVYVVVYADGASVVAGDVDTDLKVENIKVKFEKAT